MEFKLAHLEAVVKHLNNFLTLLYGIKYSYLIQIIFNSVWPINEILTGTTTPGQGTWKFPSYFPTGASPLDTV